jgi:hypothetical protein
MSYHRVLCNPTRWPAWSQRSNPIRLNMSEICRTPDLQKSHSSFLHLPASPLPLPSKPERALYFPSETAPS